MDTSPLWSFNSHRLKVALLLLFAMYALITMSGAIGIAIVCMVNTTAYSTPVDANYNISRGTCGRTMSIENVNNTGYKGDFLWTPSEQSTLFTASYYGSMATVLFGGSLADRFGPKRILLASLAVTTLIAFFTPTIARMSVWAYFITRIVQGMTDGFFVPAINSVSALWFPPTEKSSMAALYTSGVQLAGGTSSLVGSRLCSLNLLGGWPLIFYLAGLIGVIWIILFSTLVTDHPANNRFVSQNELMYLENNTQTQKTQRPRFSEIPWYHILTSPPFYACLLCHIAFSFCASINVNFLPMYFKEELQLSISSNGLYTMAPFYTQLIFKNIIALIADHLKKSRKLSTTATVKLIQSIGSFGTSFLFICLVTLPNCDRPWIALACLVLFGCIYASCISGFFTSMIILAPPFAGTITSIAMIFGQLGSASVAVVVSLATYMEWPYKWQIVFALGAFLQLFAGLFFLIFGSGDVMPWANTNTKDLTVDVERMSLKKESS